MAKPKDIVIDLNRINRAYYRDWIERVVNAASIDENDALTVEMLERVVIGWPYGEVSGNTYHGLGLVDAKRVDDALLDAMAEINKKK